jgi:hypothetical protein
MGQIKKGILGGFSGKVGTVVGANWKSISYMRSLPQKVKNPRTEAQVKHRAKFTFAVKTLKPFAQILNVGWKLSAKKNQKPINVAMAYTLANAIKGEFPNYEIDTAKFQISRGLLRPPLRAIYMGKNPALRSIQWDDNSGLGNAKATDQALIAIYNHDRNEVITHIGTARSMRSYMITFPKNWDNSHLVDVFIGFMSEDGKEISNSVRSIVSVL